MKKAGYTVYMLHVLNMQRENLPDTVYKNPGEVNAKVNVPNIALTFKSFPCSVEARGNKSFSTFIAVSERLIFCRPGKINILSSVN